MERAPKGGDTCSHCEKGILSLMGTCSHCPRVTSVMIPIEVTPQPMRIPNFKIFTMPFVWGDILSYNKCECGGEKANTTHSDWCPKP